MPTAPNYPSRLERPIGLFLTIVILTATAIMIVRHVNQDRGEDTPPERLLFAAACGDLTEVRRALAEAERGGEALAPQHLGDALHRAAAYGNADVVDELLRRGADPDSPRRNGVTVLMQFADNQEDGADLARRLIRAGATVDAADENGRTALMDAVAAGHVELVRVLLDAGASVAAVDRQGRSPLGEATAGGEGKLIDLLTQAGRGAGKSLIRLGRARNVTRRGVYPAAARVTPWPRKRRPTHDRLDPPLRVLDRMRGTRFRCALDRRRAAGASGASGARHPGRPGSAQRSV